MCCFVFNFPSCDFENAPHFTLVLIKFIYESVSIDLRHKNQSIRENVHTHV